MMPCSGLCAALCGVVAGAMGVYGITDGVPLHVLLLSGAVVFTLAAGLFGTRADYLAWLWRRGEGPGDA